ncbi:TetR/AcrR family transcriptional regulator [Mycolicibacterium thermoresistibile]
MSAQEIQKQLVEAGVRLLERDGIQALSARNLATEAGTSTMAVYSRFGGMTGVIEAVAGEVFARFSDALTQVPATDDPVADFFVMGTAYRDFALTHPQRYLLMFGTATPASIAGHRADITVTGSPGNRAEWAASFDALLRLVRRMIGDGRIRDDGEAAIAGRLWSLIHGEVMLELAGFFGGEGHGLTQILTPLAVDVLVGLGDDRARVEASLAAAVEAYGRRM